MSVRGHIAILVLVAVGGMLTLTSTSAVVARRYHRLAESAAIHSANRERARALTTAADDYLHVLAAYGPSLAGQLAEHLRATLDILAEEPGLAGTGLPAELSETLSQLSQGPDLGTTLPDGNGPEGPLVAGHRTPANSYCR